MRVFQSSYPGPDTYAFKIVKTRVPYLVAIPSGFNHFVTFTSTEAYHKLKDSDFGTDSTCTAIDSAVARYARNLGPKDTTYLGVIDMSLPLGGGFDVAGDWENAFGKGKNGHSWHRQDRSVDFSKYYLNSQRIFQNAVITRDGTVRKNVNRIEDDELDKLFTVLHFQREEKIKGKIHYEALPEPKN